MIDRTDASIFAAPPAVIFSGMALCPECGRPLGEPLGGRGEIAIWCRKCRRNVLVRFALGKEKTGSGLMKN